MPDFALPDLGEGLTSAEIVAWLIAEGDTVVVDQPVVEVETAKATVEVPTPYAGVVSTLHGAVGDTVAVGAPLVTVGPASKSGSAADSGRVLVGYGTSENGRRSTRQRRAASSAHPASSPRVGHPVLSPLVRRLARDHGIDAAALDGTGASGVVLRRDVQLAVSAAARHTGPDAQAIARRLPLTGTRGRAAELFSRSRREIPEATVWVDVDATELIAARTALNAARPEQPVGVLAMLARFAVLGLRRHPELNARVEPDAVVLLDEVNLGIAAQTDRGLMVPVVRDAHRLTTRELSDRVIRATAAARDGSITPAQLTGGTFTVNNYGIFGVDGSAAIINVPEVAILGMGRIIDRPWVVDGHLAVRKVAQLTLAFDHRACNGGVAGGFLRYVADCVEAPVTALGDL